MRHPVCILLPLLATFVMTPETRGGNLLRGLIVGGREASPHSRPYMVSIMVGSMNHCGAALIRRRWVMTAAHCFDDIPPDMVTVVVGAHSLIDQESSKQIFKVNTSVRHPDYNAESGENDLQLLKLNKKASMNHFVGNISLPRRNEDVAPGTICAVAGWGDISDFNTSPIALMETSVSVMDRKACNASWKGAISENVMCATSSDGALRGFCSGDSGGPLVCGKKAVGVVSFSGLRCGNPRFPDVYTRVSMFMGWIRDVTKRI